MPAKPAKKPKKPKRLRGTPPFETVDLRKNLTKFFNSAFADPITGKQEKVGNYTWGVYAFFDYEQEPIYVGQTNERIRTRIGRHLTNQRTDAVAMSVLDPFEVYEIEVWPLPQFQGLTAKKDRVSHAAAKLHLNALEREVYKDALAKSKFGAVLNEVDPPRGTLVVPLPPSLRTVIVGEEVRKIRSHPDFRIARRALISSRLAQVISERQVQGGLRRVMLTQARRMEWLANIRYEELGGAASVETEDEKEAEIKAEEEGDDGLTEDTPEY